MKASKERRRGRPKSPERPRIHSPGREPKNPTGQSSDPSPTGSPLSTDRSPQPRRLASLEHKRDLKKSPSNAKLRHSKRAGAKQREQPGKFEPHLYDPSGLKHPVGPRSYTKGAQVQPQQINKDVTMRSDYPGAQRHKPGLLVFDLRKSRVQGRWRVSLCVCVVL